MDHACGQEWLHKLFRQARRRLLQVRLLPRRRLIPTVASRPRVPAMPRLLPACCRLPAVPCSPAPLPDPPLPLFAPAAARRRGYSYTRLAAGGAPLGGCRPPAAALPTWLERTRPSRSAPHPSHAAFSPAPLSVPWHACSDAFVGPLLSPCSSFSASCPCLPPAAAASCAPAAGRTHTHLPGRRCVQLPHSRAAPLRCVSQVTGRITACTARSFLSASASCATSSASMGAQVAWVIEVANAATGHYYIRTSVSRTSLPALSLPCVASAPCCPTLRCACRALHGAWLCRLRGDSSAEIARGPRRRVWQRVSVCLEGKGFGSGASGRTPSASSDVAAAVVPLLHLFPSSCRGARVAAVCATWALWPAPRRRCAATRGWDCTGAAPRPTPRWR